MYVCIYVYLYVCAPFECIPISHKKQKLNVGLIQTKSENKKDTEYTETIPTIAFDVFHEDSKHMVMICMYT